MTILFGARRRINVYNLCITRRSLISKRWKQLLKPDLFPNLQQYISEGNIPQNNIIHREHLSTLSNN